jgi:putative salt-induced outer membrane protein YdiY
MPFYCVSIFHSMSPTTVPSTATPSIQPTYYPSLSPHSVSVISTFAGTGTASYSGDGGQATSSTINGPTGIAIDTSGNVYFSDWFNNRVRKITISTGIITTYAGTGSSTYSGDGGVASSAALSNPDGLCIDSSGRNTYVSHYSLLIVVTDLLGNLYIAEYSSHRIRKVTSPTSVISTIAGTGTASYSGDNGQATSATLNTPIGVAVDTSGKCK